MSWTYVRLKDTPCIFHHLTFELHDKIFLILNNQEQKWFTLINDRLQALNLLHDSVDKCLAPAPCDCLCFCSRHEFFRFDAVSANANGLFCQIHREWYKRMEDLLAATEALEHGEYARKNKEVIKKCISLPIPITCIVFSFLLPQSQLTKVGETFSHKRSNP